MKYLFTILFLSITLFSNGQTVEDDFEGNGTISTWATDESAMNTSFANPYKESINTSNTVLEYKDDGGQYANIFFDTSNTFDLSAYQTFTLKIYVPSASLTQNENNQISLKLQDNTLGEKWTTQTEIIKPIILDQWQTIAFDFKNDTFLKYNENSADPINRKDFNRVLIQINGEDNNAKVTAYIDDFLYDGTITDSNNNSGEDPVFDNLVWSDEFNGTGPIDAGKWFKQTRPIINGQDWANGEIQHYTDRNENSFMVNGSLKIVAKKETYNSYGVTKQYTSARLNSKFAFTYGKIEIRAKMPFGVGTFPALWMLGQNITETGGYWAATHGTTGWPDCGEIDIIEHWGNNQDFVQSAMHNRSSFGGTVNKGGRKINNASTEFHIYTLDWNSNKMTFSVDGIVHYVYNPEDKNIQNWPYNAPQYLLFNVAILPNIASNFTESAMEIDYVRVYQESVASVSDINNLLDIKLFPNPVNDKLNIQFSSDLGKIKGTIYSLTGQKIQTFVQNSSKKTIETADLSKGIYFLKLESTKGTSTHKIVKK
jgi:beta-glucanase (GH16 family)